MKDKYCFNIPQGGSKSLDILEYCFNESTQLFLLKAGLRAGMKVLEIGCGSGQMSCWIANKIGAQGQLLAIDNNQHQIDAARAFAEQQQITNAEFTCHDAYQINELGNDFDLIYCRFVLHHVSRPREVISKCINC